MICLALFTLPICLTSASRLSVQHLDSRLSSEEEGVEGQTCFLLPGHCERAQRTPWEDPLRKPLWSGTQWWSIARPFPREPSQNISKEGPIAEKEARGRKAWGTTVPHENSPEGSSLVRQVHAPRVTLMEPLCQRTKWDSGKVSSMTWRKMCKESLKDFPPTTTITITKP